MLKQVQNLSKNTDERIFGIWRYLKTRNRNPELVLKRLSSLWDEITIGEKVDSIIDYLGIEIIKTHESTKVEARKLGEKK